MSRVLLIAGVYNLAWGTSVVLWPALEFQVLGMPTPNYIEIWQCLGMVIGVFGVGYLIAATDPLRHWPIVFVGSLGKVCGPLGFVHAAASGRLPWSFGWSLLFNDLIWWVPFAIVLYKAYELRQGVVRQSSPEVQEMALRNRTNKGSTMLEMSRRQPMLVVFLRHFGCAFCRETLSDLSRQRKDIEATGTQIVLVHMVSDQQAHDVFHFYGLSDLPRVSDDNRVLYRAFGLGRGGLLNLVGPSAMWRFMEAAVFERHGFGWIVGDGFQMPGIFVIFQGQILRSFLHQSVADRPNYRRMVQMGMDDGSAVAS
jgi:peroxiredoxin